MRILSFALGILLLTVNFFMTLREDRERAKENARLHAKLDSIESGIKALVAQGRLSSEEADRLLKVNVGDSVTLQDEVKINVIRGSK